MSIVPVWMMECCAFMAVMVVLDEGEGLITLVEDAVACWLTL